MAFAIGQAVRARAELVDDDGVCCAVVGEVGVVVDAFTGDWVMVSFPARALMCDLSELEPAVISRPSSAPTEAREPG